MLSLIPPRIKICCIQNMEEARLAISMGASALGLVGPMPSGPGMIPDARIREIAAAVPPPVSTFLLSSETEAERIIAHHQQVYTSAIQLVDKPEKGACRILRRELPGIKLVQVIHVLGEESLEEAREVAPQVDALLLDSGNPKLEVKELGGTGRTHNWAISRKIREAVEVPVFLAGGLKGENIREAIRAVQPFGVDMCSGVRTDGVLDDKKLFDACCKAVLGTGFG
jgi:phosphoribosylanthranilate isomerase